jgi:serine/threonine protein kinase
MIVSELISQVLDEKYQIEKLLGQGGMGAVFLATHIGTVRPVALKIITPEFMGNAEFVERFKREAKAAGRLNHPNVVNVTDFGFADTSFGRVAYLVMEYLQGGTLGALMKEKGKLQLPLVVDIAEQACLAIDEAHKHGIIHRDLKPDNIWLEPNERGGYKVKVLDFGLAKWNDPNLIPGHDRTIPLATESGRELQNVTGTTIGFSDELNTAQQLQQKTIADNVAKTDPNQAELTGVGAVLGTPIYMSPEQCAGEALDARSDIYSFGIILYQMLAGEPPFSGNFYTLIVQHNKAEPPPLSKKRPDIPKHIEALVMQTLAKDPAQRPATAGVLVGALRAGSEGTGAILRRAFSLYGEHFSSFSLVTLLALLPMLFFTLIQLGNHLLTEQGSLPLFLGKMFGWVFFLLSLLTNFFLPPLVIGLLVPVVIQLLSSPLKGTNIRAQLAIFLKRWRALATATLCFYIIFILIEKIIEGLLTLPALTNITQNDIGLIRNLVGMTIATIITARFYLYIPVAMIEGESDIAALKRARILYRRARRAAIELSLISVIIPYLISIVIYLSITQIFKEPSSVGIEFTIGTPGGIIATFINLAIQFFYFPLLTIALVLCYVKTRQMSGETLAQILDFRSVNNF